MVTILKSVDLSIIIVTWNNEETIGECLKSILRNEENMNQKEMEIFLIDNASLDSTVEKINNISNQQSAISIQVTKNLENYGFARATNQGLKMAKGRYLLLLNPDTILSNHALEKMVDWLERRRDAGVLAPQLLTLQGEVQFSCREFPTYQNILWELTGIPQLIPRTSRWKMGYFDHKTEREVDQPMASCFLVRRDALADVGFKPDPDSEVQFLDESFPLYFNDVDFCYRIRNSSRRWKIVFSPIAQVIHHKGFSTKKIGTKQIFTLHLSMIQFFRKYRRNRFFLPILTFLLLVTAILRIVVRSLLSVFSLSENRKRKTEN
ncbi:glycosyltransferase family 2 protein [candidate division TA06 bacterium]|nr:glycosyltransferase family 2 protein [candidate division TA06 bacterium]